MLLPSDVPRNEYARQRGIGPSHHAAAAVQLGRGRDARITDRRTNIDTDAASGEVVARSTLTLGGGIKFRLDQAQTRRIAVPDQHSLGDIDRLVCRIFGIEQGGNFSLFPAALYRRKVADPISITPSLHAYCPVAFREDAAALGTKDLDAALQIVFWLYDHVLSLEHRIPLTRASHVPPMRLKQARRVRSSSCNQTSKRPISSHDLRGAKR
jgi:hypothetical protein